MVKGDPQGNREGTEETTKQMNPKPKLSMDEKGRRRTHLPERANAGQQHGHS